MLTSEDLQILSLNIEKIRSFAIDSYDQNDLHGWGHIQRVYQNAKLIVEKEGGNWLMIEILVYLHDIGRRSERDENIHHAVISSKLTANFLQSLNVSKYTIEMIQSGILSHSFSIGGKPQYLEAKILSDADKLDAIGAIGIFRTSAFQYEHQQGLLAVLTHIDEKLLKLKDHLYLEGSKKIAEIRTQRILDFKKGLLEELGFN